MLHTTPFLLTDKRLQENSIEMANLTRTVLSSLLLSQALMTLLEAIALPLHLRKAEKQDEQKHPQNLCHNVLVTVPFRSSS